jgi:hypothetical protein
MASLVLNPGRAIITAVTLSPVCRQIDPFRIMSTAVQQLSGTLLLPLLLIES